MMKSKIPYCTEIHMLKFSTVSSLQFIDAILISSLSSIHRHHSIGEITSLYFKVHALLRLPDRLSYTNAVIWIGETFLFNPIVTFNC